MGYYSSMIILIPAMILAFYAQAKVQRTYRLYLNVRNERGVTGAQAARSILDSNGLSGVPIYEIPGVLSDNYDPRKGSMNLSSDVYRGDSVASVAIAAHESGHALQHARSYALLNIRNTIVPVANIGSALAWPLMVLGIFTGRGGDFLFNMGILLFLGVVVFHLVTLPVEFDASRRALAQLEGIGAFASVEERMGAKRVLDAAALTYIAALAVSVANLLRMLAIRGNRR